MRFHEGHHYGSIWDLGDIGVSGVLGIQGFRGVGFRSLRAFGVKDLTLGGIGRCRTWIDMGFLGCWGFWAFSGYVAV